MKGYGGHVQSSRENTAPPPLLPRRLLMTALQTHSDELNWARRRPFHDGTSHEKFDVWPRPLSSNLYRGKRFSNHVRMRTIQSRKPVKTSEKKHEQLTRKFQWNLVPLPASSFGSLSHTGIKRRLSANFLEARVKRKDQQTWPSITFKQEHWNKASSNKPRKIVSQYLFTTSNALLTCR